ncbi:ABC-2 type transport system permease protein [Melghirimyces profundicolus]|uniref:ABC-2 type transport system permease protein n=1 Tax=Melghirimyces profundicolus TaxID=1242148 RepID=A0A2T6BS07_9BACL|nr:ABC-2 family transporter protein [Melghirimyces profundicolus]PTX58875.1 ABC-2 type transport system permease protein [Melghirimyces profundicolus]
MKLYFTLVGASIRARMQYKFNFLFSTFSYGLIMVTDFLMLAAILLRFDDIRGWSIYEVGVLYGISSASMSLYRVVAAEIHDFERYMVEGEFDSLLIRPVSPLTLLLSRNLDLNRIGGVVQGLSILGISLSHLTALPTFFWLLWYLPVALGTGLIISVSLGLMTATLAFWTHRIREFQVFTLYAPTNAANYPVSIYPGWLKWIFFTVLPVAFMNYLPATFLLQKGGEWYLLVVSPMAALLFAGVAFSFWRFGIRHYHSTGS